MNDTYIRFAQFSIDRKNGPTLCSIIRGASLCETFLFDPLYIHSRSGRPVVEAFYSSTVYPFNREAYLDLSIRILLRLREIVSIVPMNYRERFERFKSAKPPPSLDRRS